MRRIALAGLLTVALLAAAGCGGSKKSSSPPPAPSTTTTVHTTTTTTAHTTTTTTTPATATTPVGTTALTGNCVQYAAAEAKIAQAAGLAASHGDTAPIKAYFAEIVAKAPSDIKPSLVAIANVLTKYLDEVKALQIKPGQTPSPDAIAKAQKASAALNTPSFKQAVAKVQAWVKSGCH